MAFRVKNLPLTNSTLVGLVTIDFDNAAERFALVDRTDFSVVTHKLIAPYKVSGVVNIVVPLVYTTNNNLAVIMLDDGSAYDLAGADKVQADVANITVNRYI